jgi:hypothetical protein
LILKTRQPVPIRFKPVSHKPRQDSCRGERHENAEHSSRAAAGASRCVLRRTHANSNARQHDCRYRGIHGNLLDTLTADDIVWTCGLLARLSDRQWRDAFRAGGYDDAVRERYIAKLKSKIGEGLALQRRQAELATSRR